MERVVVVATNQKVGLLEARGRNELNCARLIDSIFSDICLLASGGRIHFGDDFAKAMVSAADSPSQADV